jgi:hypothetical protein
MKWIVVAIVVFIIGYTWIDFRYRKPGPGYRPYQDAQDRATTARLLNAGWQKVPVEVRRLFEIPAAGFKPVAVKRDVPGLGADLEAKFAERPQLVASIDRTVAPATVDRGSDYCAYFVANLSDTRLQAGEMTLYRRGNELVLIPVTETLPGRELRTRWPDYAYCVSFSTAKLPVGQYQARIVAKGPAASWTFQIR